ncbi:hypothetical protein Q8A73_000067 [Channa argus]|nr:hypothetical protein Q8A73_000067 [Channa argus]
MDHAQKMYLIPRHQLDALKQHQQNQNTGSIRQSVENEIDKAMANILSLPDTDLYEKAKKYSSVLQRYLSLVKQSDREKGVNLTLSGGEPSDVVHPKVTQVYDAGAYGTSDVMLEDILKHMPVKHKRHAQHILDTMAKNSVSWTGQGERVVDGEVLKGSHIYDLVKSITQPQGVSDDKRPLGWDKFLQVMASLNMPLSSIPNIQRPVGSDRGDWRYFNICGFLNTGLCVGFGEKV